MSDWPIGLSTGCFYKTKILDCLETIRDGGFGMLEICSFPKHLDYHDHGQVRQAANRMEELGLEAYSFHAPFADEIDITSASPERREHSLREIMRAAEAAAMLSVRYFVIHPGPEVSLTISPEEHLVKLKHAATAIKQVCGHCHELGIGFVLENMLPHLLFGNTPDMLWIMGAIESLEVGTCLDTGHAYLSGDIHQVTHKLSGSLAMIHANDNRGHYDDHLPPGMGNIDWAQLLGELARIEFHGGIILELAGQRDAHPRALLAEARKARLFLRNISRKLAVSSPPSVSAPSASNRQGEPSA